MLVGHLLVGALAGVLGALVSLLTGFSAWAAMGWFVLGSNVGLLISAALALLSGSLRVRRARQRVRRRVRLTLGSLLMLLLGALALGWSHVR